MRAREYNAPAQATQSSSDTSVQHSQQAQTGNAMAVQQMSDASSGLSSEESARLAKAKRLPVNTRGGFTAKMLGIAGSTKGIGNILKHADKDEELITRGQTAAVVCRVLKLDTNVPEKTTTFTDVPSSEWYHKFVIVACNLGIMTPIKPKLFKPTLTLSASEALAIANNAGGSIQQVTPDPVVSSILLPDTDSIGKLEKGRSGYENIRDAREEARKLKKEEKTASYKKIAASVRYRNQRDNAGKNVKADHMCNVTSIAMALNQLGIGANESKEQFEDRLDRQLLNDTHNSEARFTPATRGKWLEQKFDLKVKHLTPNTSNAAQAKKWFHENLLPLFAMGASAIMGNPETSRGLQYNHIVRVQWVEEKGLRIDDPFGEATKQSGQYKYNGNGNDRTLHKNSGRKGEDNLWTWEMLAAVHPKYIQVFNTKNK